MSELMFSASVGMRMSVWLATETKGGKPTGRTEFYMAENRSTAVACVLYTRGLSGSREWSLSKSGKSKGNVRSRSGVVWVVEHSQSYR